MNVLPRVGSFENAPDLLFVYHFMYNGNSLNIRNECIHGRNYSQGGQLRYAFKVTLLSLYMILFRRVEKVVMSIHYNNLSIHFISPRITPRADISQKGKFVVL